jgi:hypothetical protein
MERGNLSTGDKGEEQVRRTYKLQSTNTVDRGGSARSSEEGE